MTKGCEGPKLIKDDRRIHQAVVVQLAKVFDAGNATLIVLEDVLLQE